MCIIYGLLVLCRRRPCKDVQTGAGREHSASSASQDEGSSALFLPYVQMGDSLQWGRHREVLQLYPTVRNYIGSAILPYIVKLQTWTILHYLVLCSSCSLANV